MESGWIVSDEQFKIFKKGNLQVVCDRKRVVPNDPGADTPAIVYFYGKYKASATYWCAVGEGELEITGRPHGFHKLTEKQVEWLSDLDSEITEFLYESCK